MPHITAAEAPAFALPGLEVTGLAAPSRGSTTTCAWRLVLFPGTEGETHSVDREEIFVALEGRARASVGDCIYDVGAGDALVVPADTPFSLANPNADRFEAVALVPAGGQARYPGGEPFSPPWLL